MYYFVYIKHYFSVFFFVEQTVTQINYSESTPDRSDHQYGHTLELHIRFPPEAIIQLKMATLKKYQQLIYLPRSPQFFTFHSI